MLSLAIAEARAQFSSVLERVQSGEEVKITKGKKNEPIAVVIPYEAWMKTKPKKRKMGMLEHWNVDVEVPKMSYEELMGYPEGTFNHLMVGDE
ncbi:MAG: type II toxin-antitoxin system prevent-host-death family antitoxin [Coriobacteriia bacterium]|nr:type II toxin-antitoxin system prevent-host-death family antitoxin [Coriobacteriia bacterium]